MLHNREPYGPNEVPTNMGAPINKSQIGGSASAVQNLSSIGKLGPNQHQQLLQQFNGPEYLAYNLPNHGTGPQSHHISRHTLEFASRIPNSTPRSEYTTDVAQNGLFPYFDARTSSAKSHDSDFPAKVYQNNTNESYNHDFVQDFPLSIPEVPIMFQKPPATSNKYIQNTRYKEKVFPQRNDINAIISQETKDKYLRIENAVRHIESRIFASTKSVRQQSESQEAVEPMSQNTVTNNVFPPESTVEKTELVTTETCDMKKVLIKIETDPIEVKTEVTTTEGKTSRTDAEFTNPFVKDVNAFTKDSVTNVIRDSKGDIIDSVMNVNIVSGSSSVPEATNVVNNGPKPSQRYYECPDCGVLHQNVKRFLVHVKWHNFGLTNSRRIEKEQAKVARRAMRSGEVILGANEDLDGAGKYPCKDCHKVFGKHSSLKNHRHKFHKAKPRDCIICSQTFTDWKALRDHHATEHPPGAELACHYCGKTFKYKHTLAKHTQTHSEKTLACEQCPKKFGSDQLLKQHMKTHERVERGPTYHCTYCAKGFFESYNLRMHEQTHRNERPFTCEICSSTFGTNSTLKRHIRVSHSKSKPHECSTCHRCFATSIIRDRHEQRLHGNEDKFRHPCVKCGRKFRTEDELTRHGCRGMPRERRLKDDASRPPS